MTILAEVPFREVNWLPVDLDIETRPDGTILLANRTPIAQGLPHLPAYLRHFADERPDSVWLAKRSTPGGPWQTCTFGQARRTVDALTQALLDMRLPKGRPLAILSGNSIEHAMITFAAMQASIPVAPLSPNYALLSTDFVKLKGMIEIIDPAAYFVQDGKQFQKALDAIVGGQEPVIFVENAPDGLNGVSYQNIAATVSTAEVARAVAAIDPQGTAKYMFTSGSTGSPKAVAQSHFANVSAIVSSVQVFNFTPDRPSVRLDWTPWNHVMGFVNFSLSLLAGGQFYIDDGRPGGPLLQETIRNLREVSPTYYANVPAGYAALLPHLEQDDKLASSLLCQLETFAYAGARLPDDIGERLQKLAVRITGHRIPVTTGYGATETGPSGAFVHWPTQEVGLIGLPQPGVRFKLVPLGSGRYEVRLTSPANMLGYYKNEAQTARVFDEEGYYCLGDAATLVDPADISKGLRFAGRISEDFKLQTGTFVHATQLRSDLLFAAAPYLQDLVVCGADQPFIAVLAWPNLVAARELVGNPDLTLAEAAQSEAVIAKICEAVGRHNLEHPGSSTRIRRIVLLDRLPSIDGGEITDKGSVNSRAVQERRAEQLAQLFEEELPAGVHAIRE